MHKLLISLIFGLSFLLHVSTLRAQFCPCGPVPDCNTDNWNGPFQYTAHVGSGCPDMHTCDVYITYCWRHACGMYWDYKVSCIAWLGGCFCSSDAQAIKHSAIEQFIRDNPANLECPPCSEGTKAHWRFWQWYCGQTETVGSPNGDMTVWRPCDDGGTNSWCFNKWDVCCDSTGQHITNREFGYFPAEPHCEPPCTVDCQPLDF